MALYVTFGSESLGVPCALARVFSTKVRMLIRHRQCRGLHLVRTQIQAGVLNFNPYFNQPDPEGRQFIVEDYESEILNIVYPEDILSSRTKKAIDVRPKLGSK